MRWERFGRGGPFPSATADEGFSSVMLRRASFWENGCFGVEKRRAEPCRTSQTSQPLPASTVEEKILSGSERIGPEVIEKDPNYNEQYFTCFYCVIFMEFEMRRRKIEIIDGDIDPF